MTDFNDLDVPTTFFVGAPISFELMQILYENPLAMFEGAAGAPKIQAAALDTGIIDQAAIGASAVGQGELKTAQGEASSSSGSVTLPGGEYGFYPRTRMDNTNVQSWSAMVESPISVGDSVAVRFHTGHTSYVTSIFLARGLNSSGGGGGTMFAQQRYLQASPPYDLGDGDVRLFAFAIVDGSGNVISVYSAPEPPWIYNGPTDVRPDFLTPDGRKWKWDISRGLGIEDVRAGRMTASELAAALQAHRLDFDAAMQRIEAAKQAVRQAEIEELRAGMRKILELGPVNDKRTRELRAELAGQLRRERHTSEQYVAAAAEIKAAEESGKAWRIEIDQARYHRDMPLIPHPFLGNDLAGQTVVLLDPPATADLFELHRAGESINELLHEGLLELDNEPLQRAGPEGVQAVGFRWKNSRA